MARETKPRPFYGMPCEYVPMAEELATLRATNERQRAEVERLKAREKDLTLEGLSLIGRLEAVRDALAGTDIGSLPNDYPTQKMALDRMDELATLRAEIERLRAALEQLANGYHGGLITQQIARAALTQSEEVKG